MDNYEIRALLDGHYIIRNYNANSIEEAKEKLTDYLKGMGWGSKELEIFSIDNLTVKNIVPFITDCDADINVRKLHDIAYGKYQLKWLLEHNYSIADLISALKDAAFEEYGFIRTGSDSGEVVNDAYFQFLETGFHGEIFACKEEFLNSEYKDVSYMKEILSMDEFLEWHKEMKHLKIA